MRFAIGSYASKHEKGLHVVEYDAATAAMRTVASTSGIERPSFVAVHPEQSLLFAVSETANGELVAYRCHPDHGVLEELNRQSTGGADPCHIQLHPNGRFVLGANYSGGSIFVHSVLVDGKLGTMSDLVQHQGHSIHSDRQTSAHPHSIWNIPDTDYFVVPDLGTDTLYTYALDTDVGKLTLVSEADATAGSGPRHVAFHPRLHVLYVMNELSSSVGVFSFSQATGALKRMQADQMAIPSGADDEGNTAADIHVTADGSYVCTSNRGHDSIAVLKVLEDGCIESVAKEHVFSTRGKTPRNFAISRDFTGKERLFVANQDSDDVVVFCFDDGDLRVDGDPFSVIKPVCLARWS